jgi:hypothetical protein
MECPVGSAKNAEMHAQVKPLGVHETSVEVQVAQKGRYSLGHLLLTLVRCKETRGV